MSLRRWLARRQTALEMLALWAFSRLLVMVFAGRYGSDVPYYRELARALFEGKRPYGDFALDHPPLVLLLTGLPATLQPLVDYGVAFRAQMVLVDLALFLVLARIADTAGAGETLRKRILYLYLWLGVIGFPFLYDRFDLVLSLLVLLLVWAGLTARFGWAWFVLYLLPGLNVGTLLMWPFWLVTERRLVGGWRAPLIRSAVAASVMLTTVVLGFALFGPGLSGPVRYHWFTPVEMESLPASFLLTAHLLGLSQAVNVATGSLRLDGPLTLVAAAAALWIGAVLVLTLWGTAVWRVRAERRMTERQARLTAVLGGTLTGLLVFQLSSLVLLPQYVMWLVALAGMGLVVVRSRALWTVLWLGVLFHTILVFPLNVEALIQLHGPSVLLLIVRNLVLAVLLGWSIRLWFHREPRPSGSPVGAMPARVEAGPAHDS